MDPLLTCPRGHSWRLPDAAAQAVGASPLVCPACGPVAEARLAADAGRDGLWIQDHPTLPMRAYRGPADDAPPVAGYEIVRELGRGGMGVVYQARHRTLNRIVALKMILADGQARPQEYARFLGEAEVIASLQHPNIVQIYEIGEAGGRPYFSLEYVEGGSLAQRLRGAPLPPRQAARLIAALARAVHAAHLQGVVHRDLKPANILLAGSPDAPLGLCTPKITDFGLAKRLDSGVKTTPGFILGTPCYMAPEQAAGKALEVGPAADVYSLGAILYEMLAGRPPFQGDTPLGTMQMVLTEDPVAPTRLQPRAPADLEIICLKCLRKDPRRRYAGAAALADDLERSLEGRPVLARPAAAGERLVKWSRRRPATAAFLGVSLLALMLLLAGGAWHTLQLHDALADADQARMDAQTERDASLRAKDLAEERDRRLREFVYAVHVRQAHQLWEHADIGPMCDLLSPYAACDPDPREFTWRYLWRLSHGDRQTLTGHAADVYFLTYSPDGTKLATAGRDGTLRLWDAATGRELFVLRGHADEANCVAFSPDGASLASVGDDGRIILWDVAAGRERRRLQDSGKIVLAVAWDSVGRLLATGGEDGKVHLWDAASGRESPPLDGHPGPVESLAFAPYDGALASGGGDGTVRVWDLAPGGKPEILAVGACAVETVTWSRDGRMLAAACGDGTIRIWDANPWRPRPPLAAHAGEAHGVAFSPDGATLASGGNDHLVRLWDVETGAPRNVLKGHADRVWGVAFSPDGKTLASAGRDRVVKLWDPDGKQDWRAFPSEKAGATAMALNPRGDVLALGSPDGTVGLRSPAGDRPPETLPRQSDSFVSALAFSPDGRRLAAQGADGTVVLWDLGERRPRVLRRGTIQGLGVLSFSADGRTLASATPDGPIPFWDATTGEALPAPIQNAKNWTCLAFSPTGGLLAAATTDEFQVVLYDLGTGRPIRNLSGHKGPITCMAFAADGQTLATGSDDQTAKLWDVHDGREKTGSLLAHSDAVAAVAFHPDGKTVVTGGADRTVKLWDAATGLELASLPAHAGRLRGVAFTPDGNALISAGDGEAPDEVRLWTARSSGPRP